MALTSGRIVRDSLSAPPRYAWVEVREDGGLTEAPAAIGQDTCAALWWNSPSMKESSLRAGIRITNCRRMESPRIEKTLLPTSERNCHTR